MKKVMGLMVLSLGLILSGPVWAQPGGGQGTGPGMGGGMGPGRGMGPGGGMGMMYNPQTVTTIKGTVESLVPQTRRMRHESRVIKTDKGNVTVHLGPAWYMNQHQMIINPGDALEVTGSEMKMGDSTMMVAREVTVKGKTLKLRDDQGMPLWRGQGQPQPK